MIAKIANRRESVMTLDMALELIAPNFEVRIAKIGPSAFVGSAVPRAEFLARVPTYPATALPMAGRIANGCGISPEACRQSALGEAVELGSCCEWGSERLVSARADDLEGDFVLPCELNGFSAEQIAFRTEWNLKYGGYDWRPDDRTDRRIDWIASEDALDGSVVYLPADAVFVGRRNPGDEQSVAIADSNGCASGRTQECAKLSALLELIERDATGRWWHGNRRRPAIPQDVLSEWPELATWIKERARRTVLIDITTDLGIPVVAAVSSAGHETGCAVGFAARSTISEAACRAVIEMLGVETMLPPWRPVDQDSVLAEWVNRHDKDFPPIALPASSASNGGGEADSLEKCLWVLRRSGCRVLFVDMIRDALGVPACRAVVPELAHFKPRFGKARLLLDDPRDYAPLAARDTIPNPAPLLL